MIGCNAKFNAKEFEGRWRYTKVELGHNHDLNPEDVRYLRAYRKLPKEVERRVLINDEAGIRPSRSYLAEAVKNHGFQNLSYLEKDVRNFLQKKRQEKLAGPDSIAMYHYFMKSMKESDNFFFMLDLERDGRLRNVMWVDARSRAAYKDFCDAVGLDTTYLNNKYEMSFAPFIGINHHGQTILLGCALLSREDTESFRWLLRTWVDCMGVAPRAIITDQSIPITKAVELEMPNTRHRWCLWHIMEKQHKKLKNYKDFEKIKAAMANCVYDSMSVGEFEVGWKNFVDEFGLAKNAWLYTLYKDRRRWVPPFVNDCFWAGMSTTQRNEGVNAFFKHYVNSKTSLKQFVLKYDLALGSKCDKERLLDHQSKYTSYKILTKFAAERVFQPIYTHYAFQRVMEEVRGCLYTTPSIFADEEDYSEYKVEDTREFGDLAIEKRVEYMVRLDKRTNHVQCSCNVFEMRGIMCRHTVKILYDCGVQQIPDLYIVRRWRKDIDRPYTRVKVPYYNPVKSEIVARYEKMQEEFEKVAIKAMNTEEEFGIVMNGITLLNQNLTRSKEISGKEAMSSEQVNENEESQDVIFVFDNSEGTQTKVALQDPSQVKSVGRPRIRVRGRQKNVPKKTTSRRTNNNHDAGEGSKSKRKKVSDTVNLRDEVDPEADALYLSQIEMTTDYYHQTGDLFNNTVHAGGYTEMMQYFEQMGQSNNQLTEGGRLNMNKPRTNEKPSNDH
ncbi:protein FAR-RED IMPAIRED RESPONSE 1-like [Silene latifolia]|uniref:protein FAR-RED IMPAIRED RESPONSE 1-like n=1 Tax=Silene latifolia TaxID=37657 RepID=UPI003D77F34F